MPIPVRCPSCQASIKAPDKMAGKKAKCPRCQELIEIPMLDSSPESPAEVTGGEKPAKKTQRKAPPKRKSSVSRRKTGIPQRNSSRVARPSAAAEGRADEPAAAKKNKMFPILIGAAALLVIAVAAYFMFPLGEEGSADSSAKKGPFVIENYISGQLSGLGGIQLGSLLSIPLLQEELAKVDEEKMQKFFAELASTPEAESLKAELLKDGPGAYIEKRVSGVHLLLDTSVLSEEVKEPAGALVLEMKVDAKEELEKAIKCSKEKLKKITLEGGVEAYEKEGETGLVCALDSNAILFGSTDYIKRLASGASSASLAPNLSSYAKEHANDLLWFCWNNTGESYPVKQGQPMDLNSVQKGELSLDYKLVEGLVLSVGLEMNSAEKAQAVEKELGMGLGMMMGMMLGLGKEDWSLTANEGKLALNVTMSNDKLAKLAAKGAGGPGAPAP
ncbi:MAG: hypothetical protein HQL32_08330 [Planctomycetes bacterium]|nr:hypothetical protein [Planctomycetota bacterium]